MRLGFSEHSLNTKSVDELDAIQNRFEAFTLLLILGYIVYPFSYAWEIGDFVISHKFGGYALLLGFILCLATTVRMFNQIEAVKNTLDPERLQRKLEEKKPPTKLTRVFNKFLYLWGIIIVGGLVWLGVSLYKDVGLKPISNEGPYKEVLSKLESKQCTLSGYHKKYDGMARPIFVETAKKQGSVISHITNDVSKRTPVSSNFDSRYVEYQCANGTVEKSQYVFRVLMK